MQAHLDEDLSTGGDGPCPLCNKPIPKLTWREAENTRLACCGKLICHCLSTPHAWTGGKHNITTVPAICDVNECPLCHDPIVKYPSKEYTNRLRSHVRDGKAWAQYLESCDLIKDPTGSPEEIERQLSEAFRLATLSAEQGYTPAFWLLGYMYEEGICVSKSDPQVFHWYEKSAKTGNAKAQSKLAFIYAQRGNHSLAVHWRLEAAQQGYPLSQLAIAFNYLEGKGVDESREKALSWFRKACKAEVTSQDTADVVKQANHMVGILCFQEGDYVQAVPFLQKAASLGNDDAKGFLETIRINMGMPPGELDTRHPQLVKELNSKTFKNIKSVKKRGNQYFSRKQFANACKAYDEALKLFSILEETEACNAEQLKEHVIIYSNKAECLLRQKKYHDAILAATEALALDSLHEKSLLRRARATLRLLPQEPHLYQSCENDLRSVVEIGEVSLSDAQDLMQDLSRAACPK